MLDRTARLEKRPTQIARWGLLLSACWLGFPGLGEASELRETPLVKAVRRARPSVVNIRGEKTVSAMDVQPGAADGPRRVNGMGTGVVVDPRGYIVTNHHVVDGVRQILITTADRRQYTARLIAHDLETDLALVKIDPVEELPVITIGTSADLMPVEPVVAVGNAYGYEHTATRGVISALHRAVQVSDAQYYDDLIQTDASINPGNSGGPLLNIDGEMIGINVAVRAGAQGIGFAIPVDKAMDVVAKLLASVNQRQVWHGVELAEGTAGIGPGVTIASVVAKSPAAQSGLQAGDVVTSAGDIDTRRTVDFHRAMLEQKVGSEVAVQVRRAGETVSVLLTLADVPSRFQKSVRPAWEMLGMDLSPIPNGEFRRKYRTRYRGGLSVASVRADGPAARAGIRRGDVLVGLHIWETTTMKDLSYVLSRPNLDMLKFWILRGNQTYYGSLPGTTKTARRS
jgi:serine protease Do